MLIRPTTKLAKLLKIRLVDIPEEPAEGSWFANLLWYRRRKFVLLSHSLTLYSVLLVDVRTPDLHPIGSLFLPVLRQSLAQDRLGDLFSTLIPQPESEQFAKTNSRSVLGFMNQLDFQLEFELIRPDRQGSVNALDLTLAINGWITLVLSEGFPRDQMRMWLAARGGPSYRSWNERRTDV